ncbi:YajG family lipoprotein [Ferrimonas lipolytica]|uniref:Lipoprotein n=1 Tax=Ferrimonas lipolytica TaxID=2724191 RepID=A0A6H1U970_9GAMM|nr:YajG family lipoprotein [Ferrimonas lipolytica]QIZ75595.1 hypothetical protein HER31_00980 [Ferrimonas lipolytica]
MKKLLLVLSVILGGCATQPTNLVLQPIDTSNLQHSQVAPQAIAISSQDLRTETYLARVRKEGEPAQLVTAGNNPRMLMQNAIATGFTQLGYQVSGDATTQLQLQLDKLQVDVAQETLEHKGSSIAAVTVKLIKPKQELTKRFVAKGSFKGVMAADAAQMESELNARVQQLLQAVINDQEIHQFINQGVVQ